MFIKSLATKDVNTKYGLKQKYLLTNENGDMFDSWFADWNKDWHEGMTIEVKPEQIEAREYNGKTYKTIKPIKTGSPAQGQALDLLAKLDERTNEMLQILRRIESIQKTPQDVDGWTPIPNEPPPDFLTP